jgi:hypothetical protein
MRTKARPRSQGGEPTRGRRFRAEHRVMGPRTGAEEENQGKAEEPRRRTEARPKVSCGAPRRRRGAKEEHQGEAEEPRTAEAEEGTAQEHHRGRGRDRAGAPPRPRKGPSRSTTAAEEGIEQERASATTSMENKLECLFPSSFLMSPS